MALSMPSYAYRVPNCRLRHVVKRGETLTKIAKKHNTSASKIKKLNKLRNKNILPAGKIICLNNEVKKCPNSYTVKKGDTLSLLAKANGMEPPYDSALEIASKNGVTNANRIEVGDKICFEEPKKEEPKKEEPVVAAVPIVIAVAPAPVEERDHFGFFVTPFLSFGKVDFVDNTTGTRGSVLSKTNFGLELKFMQFLTESFSSEFIATIEQRSFKTKTTRTFGDHGGQMLNIGVGIAYNPIERMELKAKLMYGDEYYFRMPSTTSLAMDPTKAFKTDISASYDLFRSTSKKYITGIGAGLRMLSGEHVTASDGTAYKANFGYGYFGSFYVRQKFKHIMLEESFVYEDIRKDTELFNQTLANMYLRMGILFLF